MWLKSETWYLFLVTVSTLVTLISLFAVWRVTHPRQKATPPRALPPVSVLKPLCGADDALEENLESFFRQRYPLFELVFGVEGDTDPAIAVVRRLRQRHPHVRCRLVIHDGGRGLNPKVSNLRAMLETGSHDLVLISDSNVAVDADYLAEMVSQHEADQVGMVTHLIAGSGERTLGATLEVLHLMGSMAGSVAAAQVLSGNALVVGKSMMFRRSLLDRLGGLESVASVLAEDYIMGRMITEAGLQVRLSSKVVRNVCMDTTVKAFMQRHLRWGLLRSRLAPLIYPLEPLLYPAAMALAAPFFGVHSAWPWLWAIGLTLSRDAMQWLSLRGTDGLARALPLGLLKDLLMLAVWMVAPFKHEVSWRGRSLRVSMGTRLYSHTQRQGQRTLLLER